MYSQEKNSCSEFCANKLPSKSISFEMGEKEYMYVCESIHKSDKTNNC